MIVDIAVEEDVGQLGIGLQAHLLRGYDVAKIERHVVDAVVGAPKGANGGVQTVASDDACDFVGQLQLHGVVLQVLGLTHEHHHEATHLGDGFLGQLSCFHLL